MTAIDRTSVRIASAADEVRKACNAAGDHAYQGATYGYAATTTVEALAVGLSATNRWDIDMARSLADELYDILLDCGESIEYVLNYEGIEVVENEYPLPDWIRIP